MDVWGRGGGGGHDTGGGGGKKGGQGGGVQRWMAVGGVQKLVGGSIHIRNLIKEQQGAPTIRCRRGH